MNLVESNTCSNCSKKTNNSKYCPHCGQKNINKRISIKQFFSDFLEDAFSFDSKLFRSLYPLFFKPGFLTKEYILGRRTRYIAPIRLYIFTAFVFFTVVTINYNTHRKNMLRAAYMESSVAIDSLKNLFNSYGQAIPKNISNDIVNVIDTTYTLLRKPKNEQGLIIDASDSTDNFISKYITEKGHSLQKMGNEGVYQLKEEMTKQLPKVFFVLLPAFALILLLLYRKHNFYYLEHLTFALHLHTYVFLILFFVVIFPYWYVFVGVFLCSLIYLFIALRKVYQQSFFHTTMKLILLLFLYLLSFIPASIVLLLFAIVSV